MCWGDEAVSAADNTKDLDGARTVLAKSGLKRDGSITGAFERISKETVSYSHRQHTYTETRYVVVHAYNPLEMMYGATGSKSFDGSQRASALL
jgi:hypothetical protein